ncbi:hypothetical protein BSKO_13381 [Bryopsis sp. KO-2023]|nr:hypothetical protein BSKO_13381 [Bryopsis sp. KO-2023]
METRCTHSLNLSHPVRIFSKAFQHRVQPAAGHEPSGASHSERRQNDNYMTSRGGSVSGSRRAAGSCAALSTPAVLAAGQDPLLIVGPGVLGTYLGKLWLDDGGEVIGQSNTVTNHGRLKNLGITPRTNEESSGSFSYVAFCAPPSGSQDLTEDVKKALALWNGSGCFLYTSSMGVYKTPESGLVSEHSELNPLGESERMDRMLKAEAAVLEAGGNVVRLAGLYHANRGAHSFFLKKGTVDRWGGYALSLLHYEDAASLAHAILKAGEAHRGEVFLGHDSNPITMEDMMDVAISSGVCPGEVKFVGKEGKDKGKKLDNRKTIEMLNNAWEPKYKSFSQFMEAGGKDWYTTSGVF